MARGFWTGVVHGGALSAGLLAVLAILLPVPPRVPPQTAAQVDDAAPAGEADAARPDAPVVDLPVGSEFARGGDVTPRLPAPLALPPDRVDQAEAPAVSAPAAEPAPVAVTSDVQRPVAPDPGPTRPDAPAPVDAVEFDRPGALELPAMSELPGFAGAGAADELPQESPVAEALPAPDPLPEPEPLPEPGPQPEPEPQPEPQREPGPQPEPEPLPVPGRAAPVAPDLSLPPDFSDLRPGGRAGD